MATYDVQFRLLFQAHLRAQGFTQAEFADRVGRSQVAISQVVVGKSRPPLEDISHWAATLRLVDQEREKFIRLANLCHVPDYVANIIEQTERMIQQQGDQILNLQAVVIRLERERARRATEGDKSPL
jgi:transcriptional regulator with XRE-family HTH domain